MFTAASGFYASVSTVDIKGLLEYYLRVTQVPCPRNESSDIGLHCTVMYSKVAPKVSPAYMRSRCVQENFEAKVVAFEWWPGHDEKGYLVALLSSPQLEEQNKMWKLMGAVSSDTYEPHITLAEGTDSLYHQHFLSKLNSGLRAKGSISILMGKETIDDLS